MPEGPYKGEAISKNILSKVLDHYYELRGWDKKTGIPTRRKLEELELRRVADELEKNGKTTSLALSFASVLLAAMAHYAALMQSSR